MILTTKRLDELPKDTIFEKGLVEDSPKGCNMANTGRTLQWVAVTGGIGDWAIYIDNPFYPQSSFEGVRDLGDKVHNPDHIKKLVPCDDESFKRYRH